jgi:esterase/lipase superfamily enzyme
MIKPGHYLIAGGVVSTLISMLHFILALKPALYRHISAGQESALAQMAEQGSSPTTIATVALALIFATCAIYAFSGTGLINRLPLLRAALIAIAGIYILRALFIPTEVNMVLKQGYPFRFVVFSTISLAAELLYLMGVLKLRSL